MCLIYADLWCCIESNCSKDGNEVIQNKKKEQSILATISLFAKSSFYQHVRNTKTPKETWEDLQKVF